MIKINKQLTDSTGGPVASGTVVRFSSEFAPKGMVVTFRLFCYKSDAADAAGLPAYVPVEIKDFSFKVTLTSDEYSTLEVGGAATLIHNKVKMHIAAMPGFQASDLQIIL